MARKKRRTKKNPVLDWILIAGGLIATAFILVPMLTKKEELGVEERLRLRKTTAKRGVEGFGG